MKYYVCYLYFVRYSRRALNLPFQCATPCHPPFHSRQLPTRQHTMQLPFRHVGSQLPTTLRRRTRWDLGDPQQIAAVRGRLSWVCGSTSHLWVCCVAVWSGLIMQSYLTANEKIPCRTIGPDKASNQTESKFERGRIGAMPGQCFAWAITIPHTVCDQGF